MTCFYYFFSNESALFLFYFLTITVYMPHFENGVAKMEVVDLLHSYLIEELIKFANICYYCVINNNV